MLPIIKICFQLYRYVSIVSIAQIVPIYIYFAIQIINISLLYPYSLLYRYTKLITLWKDFIRK